jgi:hypothetical protein
MSISAIDSIISDRLVDEISIQQATKPSIIRLIFNSIFPLLYFVSLYFVSSNSALR